MGISFRPIDLVKKVITFYCFIFDIQTNKKPFKNLTKKQIADRKRRAKADARWGKYNKELIEAMKDGNASGLSITYRNMAIQVEKEGKPSSHLFDLSHKFRRKLALEELLEMKNNAVKEVEICGRGECQVCLEANGKKFDIDDAIKTMPIPVEGCTNQFSETGKGWCICCYLAVVK